MVITDGKKLHYLAVKKLSALLEAVTWKHGGYFYCLNCFHCHTTKNKLKKHYNVCKNCDSFYAQIPNECNEILKYNHGEKSIKVPFNIYADLESLLKKWALIIIILKNHQ